MKSSHFKEKKLQKIIVTGSSGKLGTVLCKKLTENGIEVVGIDIKPSDNNITTFFEGDVGDPAFLRMIASEDAISGVSGILKCFFYPEFPHNREIIPGITRSQRLAL
jgi:dTDP-4-dehydrorhamnose reductase